MYVRRGTVIMDLIKRIELLEAEIAKLKKAQA